MNKNLNLSEVEWDNLRWARLSRDELLRQLREIESADDNGGRPTEAELHAERGLLAQVAAFSAIATSYELKALSGTPAS